MAVGIALMLSVALTLACGATEQESTTEQRQTGIPHSTATTIPDAPSSVRVSGPTVVPTEISAPTPEATPTSAPAPTTTSAAQVVVAETPVTQAAIATTSPKAGSEGESGTVAPDPDYERAFADARLNSRGWDTDFRFHTVPYSEIKFIIPRDNIPSIDSPRFVSPTEASAWLKDVEPVVTLDVDGDARAYPPERSREVKGR